MLPKGNLFFVNTRCPRGELKAIQIYISVALYYLRPVSVFGSQIYNPISKASGKRVSRSERSIALPKRNTSISSMLFVCNLQPNHECRPSRKLDIYFLRSLSALPKGILFFVNARCPRGELKAILIYISLGLYFLRSVSVLPVCN